MSSPVQLLNWLAANSVARHLAVEGSKDLTVGPLAIEWSEEK